MLLVQYTLIYASVLICVALGGMFSERSGVINIGLEGIMVFGALGGALVLGFMPDGTNPLLMIFLTVFISMFCGMIFSLLLAVSAINFKADQTLVSTVIVKAINTKRSGCDNVSAILDYIQSRRCFIFKCFGIELNVYMIFTAIIVIVSFIVLYKTRFGLRLMACGEHPQAADSVGINVYKMRYAGVLISGALGGFGGIIYITAANSQWDFIYGVAGAGFLSLAVMIFGQWKPLRIALAAIVFGVFRAIADAYMGFDVLVKLVSGEFYKMLPYIISLVVLAFTSKKSKAPKAEGIPYDKGIR